MQEIQFNELEEKGTYIVESKERIGQDSIRPFSKKTISSEFEEMLEYDNQRIMTIIKIELPYFVIKSRHGREMVKLSESYRYLKPSDDFVKLLNHNCGCDY